MVSKKKVLFFGLGSIGKRHLNLLKQNYDFDLYAYRSQKGNPVPEIKNIYSFKDALKIKPDIAFITNPTYLHIETALSCLEVGIKNIFIEKPLSDSKKNLDLFQKRVEETGAFAYVGNSMRFNPILKRLKQLVDERIDQIFYTNTFTSSYLPLWRPGRDYTTIYSSKKDQGGGVILDLIHEFDYNEWLFGEIKQITGVHGRISPLEIDTEDFCDVSLVFDKNIKGFIHLDYFGHYNQRKIQIFSIKEQIIADLINNYISLISGSKIKKETFKFERNDYFETQLRFFIDEIDNRSKGLINLSQAKELVKKIIHFKENNKMIIYSNK